MFMTPRQRACDRCSHYLAIAFFLVAASLILPPALSVIGLTLPFDLALTIMLFGVNGLIPVSILWFVFAALAG